MPDNLTQISQGLARRKSLQEVELPSADELAQGLMMRIGIVSDLAEGRPILQNQVAIQESTRQPIGELRQQMTTGGQALQQGISEFQQQPAGTIPGQQQQPFAEFFAKSGLKPTIADEIAFEKIREANKPVGVKGLEDVNRSIKESVQKINDAFDGKLDSNLFERITDLALGAVGTPISVIMSGITFSRAPAEKLGKQIGGNLGKAVAEILPFLTFPNPIAFFAAAKGSEIATEQIMDIVSSTSLSDKNKGRILEAVGLGTFIFTHRGITKLTKSLKTPKVRGELKSFIETEAVKIKPIETKPVEGLTQEKLPLKLGEKDGITSPQPKTKGKDKSKKEIVKTETEAQKEVKVEKPKENVGQNLESLTESGKKHFSESKTFAEWSKKMVKEFGKEVTPEALLRTWDKIKKESTGEPSGKIRGFAKSTEKRAIESGLVKEIKDLPTYEPKRDKPRIEEVSKIIENDFERAKRIALGLETHPTVEAGFFHEGLRLVAEKNGDANLIIELANSKISVEATEAGRFIQALKDHNPLSTVRAVKEIIKERVSRVKDSVRKKVTKTTKTEVKAQMKKNNLKFKDWNEFVRSIECV